MCMYMFKTRHNVHSYQQSPIISFNKSYKPFSFWSWTVSYPIGLCQSKWGASLSAQHAGPYDANSFSVVYAGAVGVWLHIHLKPQKYKINTGERAERDLKTKKTENVSRKKIKTASYKIFKHNYTLPGPQLSLRQSKQWASASLPSACGLLKLILLFIQWQHVPSIMTALALLWPVMKDWEKAVWSEVPKLHLPLFSDHSFQYTITVKLDQMLP